MSTSLTIHADPSCPWCYLGLARFERARAEFDADIFSISTVPFLINPDLPPEGMDIQLYFMSRYGEPDEIAKVLMPLQKAVDEDQIPFALNEIKTMPNTQMAQSLLMIAREVGLDYPLLLMMQNAYFQRGADLGDQSVLLDLAQEAGLERAPIAALLEDQSRSEALFAEIKAAAKLGIREVPTVVIGNHYVVSGAQSVMFWRNVISEIDEKGRDLARATQNSPSSTH